MDTSYNRYLSYSARELQAHLDKQRDTMSAELRQHILDTVSAEKRRLRSVSAKQNIVKATWQVVERPLKAELRIVVNMGRYKSKSYHVPERSAAIAEYRKVLEKLCKIMDKYKRGEHTPNQLAKIKSVPNNGEHWVDWIPANVKENVTALFDAIPHHFKAKSKVPFERRNIDDERDVRIRRLARAVKQELERAYKDLANDPDEYDNHDHHEYICRMILAQQAIIALPDDAYVPATWQGLFKTGYEYPITEGATNGETKNTDGDGLV